MSNQMISIPRTQALERDIPQGHKRSSKGAKATQKQVYLPKFEFVTSNGPPDQVRNGSEYSRTVRVHAMRYFLQHKKTATSEEDSRKQENNISVEKTPLKATTGKFKLETWSRKNRKSKLSHAPRETESILKRQEMNFITLGKDLGPLMSLIIPSTALTARLLDHYHHGFTQNSFAVNPEGSFFHFALPDVALFYATMSLVAIHLGLNGANISDPSEIFREAVYNQTEAVRDVNRRLNAADAYLSDSLVGAVAILANCETMTGTYETAAVHMAGLKRLVNLRGGLQAFSHNDILQRVLTWADFGYSSTWGTPPIFQLLPRLSTSLTSNTRLAQFSTASVLNDAPAALASVRPQVLETMHNMRLLVFGLSFFKAGHEIVDRATISNSIYSIEHRLLSLRSDPDDSFQLNGGVNLSDALVLAHHIFMHLAIRELPRTAKMHVNMLTRLEHMVLLDSPSFELEGSQVALQLFFWTLFVGAAAALAQSSRLLFVSRLRQVCEMLNIKNVKEFEEAVRNVLWMDGYCELHSGSVWNDMIVI